MTYGDMRALTRPWRGPFRVHTTDGVSYDVRFSEQFVLTTAHLHIGLLKDPEGDTLEHAVYIDLGHITRLEPLTQASKPKGDGQAAE